jgi:hypothetical protein
MPLFGRADPSEDGRRYGRHDEVIFDDRALDIAIDRIAVVVLRDWPATKMTAPPVGAHRSDGATRSTKIEAARQQGAATPTILLFFAQCSRRKTFAGARRWFD